MTWDTIPEIHLLDKECFNAVKTYEQSPEEHSTKSKEEGKCSGYRRMSMTSEMSSVLSKSGSFLLSEAVEAECYLVSLWVSPASAPSHLQSDGLQVPQPAGDTAVTPHLNQEHLLNRPSFLLNGSVNLLEEVIIAYNFC